MSQDYIYIYEKPPGDTGAWTDDSKFVKSRLVTSVIDGDTIDIDFDEIKNKDGVNRIRFLCVDAAETKPKDGDTSENATYKREKAAKNAGAKGITTEQEFQLGAAGKKFLKNLLDGKLVSVDFTVKEFEDSDTGEVKEWGRDTYDRALGVIYCIHNGHWINVNKTMLANKFGSIIDMNSGHILASSWAYLVEKDNSGMGAVREQESEDRDFYRADRLKELIIDTRSGYMDNSIKINGDNEVIDNRRLRGTYRSPGYMQIGDVELVVPPLAISVNRQMQNSRVNVLRSKSSIQTKSGHHECLIEIELFFNSTEAINGYEITGPGGIQQYVNGLRPLISQFKRTPFVPIVNDDLNYIHGIFNVSLVNMTAQTVPGFPDCVSVVLTMMKFEHSAYLSYTEHFYDAINWPLFRWYCQGPMTYKNDDQVYLQPITGRMNNRFVFELADEDELINLRTQMSKLPSVDTMQKNRTKDTNTLYGKIRHDADCIRYALKIKDNYYVKVKKDPSLVIYTEILPDEAEFDYIESDVMYTSDNISINFGEGESSVNWMYDEADNENNTISVTLLYSENIRMIKEADLSGITWNNVNQFSINERHMDLLWKIVNRGAQLDKSTEEKFTDWRKQKDAIENAERTLKLTPWPIDDLYVKSINVGLDNIVSKAQVQGCESPSHQYLGSQDTYIQVAIETTNKDSISQLVNIARTAERFARDYKLGMNSAFLGIQSDIVNLFGVRNVLIENMSVSTVRNFPGRYEIRMSLVSFDRNQRRAEEPIALDIDRWIKSSKDVQNMYNGQDELVEIKLLNLELYPDLELPTFVELLEFCSKAKVDYTFPEDVSEAWKTGAPFRRYVDPDFYVHTPKTFRNYINESIDREVLEAQSGNGGNYKLDDFLGSAYVRVPNSSNSDLDGVQPLYDVSEDIIEYSKYIDAKDMELQGKYAPSGGKPVSTKTTGTSKARVKSGELMTNPTTQEVQQWFSVENNIQANAKIKSLGVNPKHKDIEAYARAEVKRLFDKSWDIVGKPDLDLVLRYVKSIMSQETTNWQQFTPEKTPLINTTGDIGIMQYNMYAHGTSKEDLRKLCWDWKFNVTTGITLFYFNVQNAIKAGFHTWNDALKWGANIYHYGHVSKEDEGGYMRDVCVLRDKYYALYNQGRKNATALDLGGKYIGCSSKDADAYEREQSYYRTGLLRGGIVVEESDKRTFVPGTGVVDEDKIPENDPTLDPHKVWRGMFNDMIETDMRGRLVRAFPTFQMFLIDEGRWVCWLKMWDNFYGFNAIQSIDVLKSRKIAADTCIIKMTNVYSNLTRYDLDLVDNHYSEQYNWHELLLNDFDNQSLIEARKEHITSLYLKTGARIQLKLGYGSCAADLPTVFTGTITELDAGGDVIQIVGQGDGIELTNQINGEPDRRNDGNMNSEIRSTLIYLMARHNSIIWNWIENNVKTPGYNPGLLMKMFEKPENPLGVTHFGNPLQFPAGIPWPWQTEGSDEVGELGLNIYTSASTGSHSQWIYDEYSAGAKMGGGDGGTLGSSRMDWHLEWGIIPWPDGDEPDIKAPIFGKTIWDLAQTFALVVPDYVCAVLPFESRSTLFYGKPYWPYYYRYKLKYRYDELTQTYVKSGASESLDDILWKPMQQVHVYNSYTDIISNDIRASEDGVVTNVIVTYKSGDSVETTTPVHTDVDIYPEKQKTAIINLDLDISEKMAYAAAAQSLRDFLKDMYKGDLIVLGDPSVKPHDLFYIADEPNDMTGMAGVKQVVHHMSHETGFVTNISPDAIVIVDDKFYLNVIHYALSTAIGITTGALGTMLSTFVWKKLTGLPASILGKEMSDDIAKFLGTKKSEIATVLDKYSDADALINQKAGSASRAFQFKNAILAGDTAAIEAMEGATEMRNAMRLAQAVKAGKTIGSVGMNLIKFATSSTGIGLILTIGSSIIAEHILESWARYKRNMQAVLIMPLHSHGKQLVAGINGHRGCVVGDKPSKMDLWFDGKVEGAAGWLPKAMNFLSAGTTETDVFGDTGED